MNTFRNFAKSVFAHISKAKGTLLFVNMFLTHKNSVPITREKLIRTEFSRNRFSCTLNRTSCNLDAEEQISRF